MPIALITDFGIDDYYVGAMKGVILTISPTVQIIDITHSVPPQDIATAAFTLEACFRNFPSGTIFLCVVDPGVGSDRRGMLIESQGYKFVGPDNGMFSFLFGEASIRSITNDKYFQTPVSSTFHGRDIFSPVAAHLSCGVKPSEVGPVIDDPISLEIAAPAVTYSRTLTGRVIHIDRFGNIVTNITAEMAADAVELELSGHRITDRREFYGAAEPGKAFFLLGSAGFIEISINGGSAADILDVKVGSVVTARPR